MELTKLIQQKTEINNNLANIKKEYEENKKFLLKALSENTKNIIASSSGIDLNKMNHGLTVIEVGMNHTGQRRLDVINDAMKDLSFGGEKLKKNYFGVKNYSSFGDQREDHNYGYGPRHGSTVFKVGLIKKDELTKDDIEAAIYVLANIDSVNKARQEGKKVA